MSSAHSFIATSDTTGLSSLPPLVARAIPARLIATEADRALEQKMLEFFVSALCFRSTSGKEREFVHFVADWGRQQGFHVDIWQASESLLGADERKFARHLPLAGRPTLVFELPGDPALPSLLFNAHADVVSADGQSWTHDPWTGTLADGRVYGRGACDDKGPLVSALWAMARLARQPQRRGSVRLELVPGEEDCVGLGTLTSVVRGWDADAVVVLEPTEQLPRCASRGGCRFEIDVTGRAVHGTFKWLGRDAIVGMNGVITALAEVEAELSGADEGDSLFSAYPILRPITVDSIHGGEWQGMVCDRCTCGGYFELLPADDLDAWQRKFAAAVGRRMRERGMSPEDIQIRFTEAYQGHRLSPAHPMCRRAIEAVSEAASEATAEAGFEGSFAWAGFNSGCEAGLRANRMKTPTLVWGPGSLAQAHAADEFVQWADVRQVADAFERFAAIWTINRE